jgi:CubicO group peptidase (beta-lactamase class C family)
LPLNLKDYDTASLRNFSYQHPDYDFTPLDAIWFTNKTFEFVPGTHASYSSTNYEILGLLLAAHTNGSSWRAYDQHSVIPAALRQRYADTNTSFALGGACSKYTDVHGYDISHIDISNFSSLGGWTCGNVVTSALGAATFYFDLLNGEGALLSNASVHEMTVMRPLDVGYAIGIPYGLGLMALALGDGTSLAEWYCGHGTD